MNVFQKVYRTFFRKEINLTAIIIIAGSLLAMMSCSQKSKLKPVFLGQGVMAGEVTQQAVILQTRLTGSETIVDGDMPGEEGYVRFFMSSDETMSMNLLVSPWIKAEAANDFIIKHKFIRLEANQVYYYHAEYGQDSIHIMRSDVGKFRTNPGPNGNAMVSFAVVTGMNYYHFHFGKYDSTKSYKGEDKALGYPALEAIARLRPTYFIGTGDNIYFDHPAENDFQRAIDRGTTPAGGYFDGKAVTNEEGMRRKYHLQFAQPRFKELFKQVGTYWEKDDHDYRYNDDDPYVETPISHKLGIKNFREQLPIVDPNDPDAVTYRTLDFNQDAQVWFLEGRDYRSANSDPDGPEKSMWGKEQLEWLKETLLKSPNTFKFIISPTPMVGPDDAYKRDNHTNPEGFKHEGDAFFEWLKENDFLNKNLFIICGDRHWQYHAVHPSGFEEFSCGALVDNNSRAGRLAGDPNSTDPNGLIEQKYIQGTKEEASGGFLKVDVIKDQGTPKAIFSFYDEIGELLYQVEKLPK